MGEMAEHRIDFRGPLARLDIEPKRPRGSAAKGKFRRSKQPDMFVPSAKKGRTQVVTITAADIVTLRPQPSDIEAAAGYAIKSGVLSTSPDFE